MLGLVLGLHELLLSPRDAVEAVDASEVDRVVEDDVTADLDQDRLGRFSAESERFGPVGLVGIEEEGCIECLAVR